MSETWSGDQLSLPAKVHGACIRSKTLSKFLFSTIMQIILLLQLLLFKQSGVMQPSTSLIR